jgi:cation/acetate symporter
MTSGLTIGIFIFFVIVVLGLSFYLGAQSKSAHGFFAAGGSIHWGVNGIAFAGDYLSAASFLGIAGMIATLGYDGFLYSIGYLAGWIVALFVIAEPIKRLGKYTFADALNSQFKSKGIHLAAGVSALVVSLFYLIPQMVGAGSLINPLFGIDQTYGVIIVGVTVIIIVATAGMTSTTYVQFFKGGLLLIFSSILTVAVLTRGLTTNPDNTEVAHHLKIEQNHRFITLAGKQGPNNSVQLDDPAYKIEASQDMKDGSGKIIVSFLRVSNNTVHWFKKTTTDDGKVILEETQAIVIQPDGAKYVNGIENGAMIPIGKLHSIAGSTNVESTGPTWPLNFLASIGNPKTAVQIWKKAVFVDADGNKVTLFYPSETNGSKFMRPGSGLFKIESQSWIERLDFVSLMLALFLGASALPHILIRYYTVPNTRDARKSTIVAIAAIGFFYILTLYMGLGAMVNGVVNPFDNNMSAPLLARLFGEFLFALISAVAFTTILGTVSGLIVAASGAVAHDIIDQFFNANLSGRKKVFAGKITAIVMGIVAIALGIAFKGVNVSFLVGLAFAVAASANLPAIVMILFWKKTTAKGVIASIIVGIVCSVGLIAFSQDIYAVYGLNPILAPVPLKSPAIISVPASLLTLVVVSLITQNNNKIQNGNG